MTNIPNFPNIRTLWGAPYNSNNGSPVGWLGYFAGQNVEISNRILTALNLKVGKQYELDTAQAGEMTATVANNDAALDPTNTSGPFYGHIAPYQPVSVVAQYPPSVNLLSPFQARSGQGWSTGAVPQNENVWTGTDPSYPSGGTGTIVTQPAAPGNSAFNFAVAANASSNVYIVAFTNVPVEPGQQYTFSTNVMNTMSAVTGSAKIVFGWYGPNFNYGPATSSYGPAFSMTTATWYSVSATATAPSNACGVSVGIVVGTSQAAAWNMEMYSSQLQLGGLTAYADPGTPYPLFSGFIERWPSQWKEGGQYGQVNATVVDAMALLSQGQLSDPLTNEITAIGSRFLYRLDDPSSGDQAFEAWGRFPALTPGSVGNAGSLTFGNAITATNPSTGEFSAGGTSPTVVAITPTTTGTTFLSLSNAGIMGPNSTFSRIVAFRWTGTVTAANTSIFLWGSGDNTGVNLASLMLLSNGTSNSAGAQLGFYLEAAGQLFSPTGVNLLDGNWHIVGFGFDATAGAYMLTVDGQYSTGPNSGGVPSNITYDTLGYIGNATSAYANDLHFAGNISYAAEFTSLLTSTQCTNLYQAWYNACSGESATARYNRILRYAGYTGPTNVGSGVLTTDMGPATDMTGSDALTCLNNVVTTENGNHWIGSDGTLNFTGRAARYNRATPAYTFGENTAAGEWPYEDLQLDYDTTHLANDVTVTNNSTGQSFYAVNLASQNAYFDRTMSRTLNVVSPQEAQDAANFLAWRYSQPLTRVSSITLNPAVVANFWPVCLSLGIGQCIQINRRPPGCPEISLLVWIENRQWTIDENGVTKLVLQCSPAITVPQAQFTVYQTTLAVATSTSSPTITVAPLTDSVNPLNSVLSPGMTFQIHSNGGVGFETKTIKSVQATGSNWSTGTITFTANCNAVHPVGTDVSEPSPNSPGNLDAYDANAQFDDVMFTY